jgi:transcriptional regulator with XRE-family HTH domain
MARQPNDRRSTPTAVLATIRQLGANVAGARQRRRWTQEELAGKAGVSRLTILHLEQGQPGTAIEAYVAALWAMGLHHTIADAASLASDPEGAVLMEARAGSRVRHAARADDDF